MKVVPATAADYDAFTRLFPELGVHDPVPSREHFEAKVVPDALFAKEGDEVAGYIWARKRGAKLHVVHVITSPTHRRRGVARVMMNAVAERARRATSTETGAADVPERWMLNVKPENVGAIALYESCGFARMHPSVSMRMPWTCLATLEGTPNGVVAHELAPEDDSRFENALGLSAGEIAGYRVLGRTAFATEDETGPTGVGLLDPKFPGAAPLRLRSAEHARAILEAMRPRVAAEHIFVFVENLSALETLLTRAGATPVLRVLQMEGAIPRE